MKRSDPLADCYICRKHAGLQRPPGGVIYEDDVVYVSHAQIREGQSDAYLGYLMLEPKRHVPGLADLSEAEARSIGWMATRLARALMASPEVDHVYSFVIGHGVPHFHMHIIPKYVGAPREYWGPRVDEWPDAPRGGVDAIERYCERLRERLAEAGADA